MIHDNKSLKIGRRKDLTKVLEYHTNAACLHKEIVRAAMDSRQASNIRTRREI